MKINLKTKELFTDEGELIKKLDCKYNVTQKDLDASNDRSMIGCCLHCWAGILKTEHLSDQELLEKVEENPDVCFFVDLKQKNISKIERGAPMYFKDLIGMCTIKCYDCNHETDVISVSMRVVNNDPCQCENCGRIYESLNNICCVDAVLQKDKPIFCEKCSSTNVAVGSQMIG